jgi:hypothetical protein
LPPTPHEPRLDDRGNGRIADMTDPQLLDVSAARREREARRAVEIDESNRLTERAGRRALAECIGLAFLGVPFYAWSWHVENPDQARVWSALGFAITYAGPFFRWVLYHMRTSETFDSWPGFRGRKM